MAKQRPMRLVWSDGARIAVSAQTTNRLNPFQLLGEQVLRRHLSIGSSMDQRKVLCRDRLPVDPLRDPALGDPNCNGKLVLGSNFLHGLLDSAHAPKISSAYAAGQQQSLWSRGSPSISLSNMGATQPKKTRKITASDKEAARRLLELWERLPKGKRPKQEDIPELGSQSAVSQYLNGKIALNFYAVCVFAKIIGCKPEDIRSDLPEQQVNQQGSTDQDLDRLWANYSREEKLLAIGLHKAFTGQITAPTQGDDRSEKTRGSRTRSG